MIRPLRRVQLWLVPILAALVALAVAVALANRPVAPVVAAWPDAVKADVSPQRGRR